MIGLPIEGFNLLGCRCCLGKSIYRLPILQSPFVLAIWTPTLVSQHYSTAKGFAQLLSLSTAAFCLVHFFPLVFVQLRSLTETCMQHLGTLLHLFSFKVFSSRLYLLVQRGCKSPQLLLWLCGICSSRNQQIPWGKEEANMGLPWMAFLILGS